MTKINLRNVAVKICDIFENWLETNNITIPNDEREESVEEFPARLFGTDYYEIEDFAASELFLYFTGEIPTATAISVEKEPLNQHAKYIVEHFEALLWYHSFEISKKDIMQLTNEIISIFEKIDIKIKSATAPIEFESWYGDVSEYEFKEEGEER